jgi:hypothetical protein
MITQLKLIRLDVFFLYYYFVILQKWQIVGGKTQFKNWKTFFFMFFSIFFHKNVEKNSPRPTLKIYFKII